MNRSITGLLIALFVLISAAFVFAAEPPVIVTHTLTGVSKGATTTTLAYSLHVINPGDAPLTDLSLSLVSRPPLVAKRTIVTVGSLGPHQSEDINLEVVARTVADPEKLAQKPLLWAGRCFDAAGKLIEFPVKSEAGGAK